jgi:hypothetical protein
VLCAVGGGCGDGGGGGSPDAGSPDALPALPPNVARCVDRVPPETAADPLDFFITPRSYPGGDPLGGVTIEVYSASGSLLASGVSPEEGLSKQVILEVPTGGRPVDVRLHYGKSGYVAGNAFVPGVASPIAYRPDISTIEEVDAEAESFGVDRDPSKAILFLMARDCDFAPLAGVRLEVEPPIPGFGYMTPDGEWDPALTETSDFGYAFAYNLEPGPVTVRQHYLGREMRSAELVLYADEYSFADLLP